MTRSYAKINWALRITGKRADGFHDLETVFQTISLHDELTFTPSDRLSLTCDDPSIPVDETNLVLRAARAVGAPPVAIRSAQAHPRGRRTGRRIVERGDDAARARRRGDLAAIALCLGSDVPFFLLGGTAYATGRGEVLTPMPPMSGIPLLLLLPEERVLTKDAFARITHYSPPLGIDAYRDFANFTNDFEEPVFAHAAASARVEGAAARSRARRGRG